MRDKKMEVTMKMNKVFYFCTFLTFFIPIDVYGGTLRFIEALDRCELLWQAGRFNEAYDYVEDFYRTESGSLSSKILMSRKEKHFGCQYEAESIWLRQTTNEIIRSFCYVNPNFSSRIKKMAESAEEMDKISVEIGRDKNFRKENNDPRKNTNYKGAKYWWPRQFIDIPFLVPDFSLESSVIDALNNVSKNDSGQKLSKNEVLSQIYNEGISFLEKKKLLDKYVYEVILLSGVKGLIDKFDDEVVQLNGYCVLSILVGQKELAIKILKEYILLKNQGYGADGGKRMAVWVLLFFAHENTDVADFLRQLPSSIGKENVQTLLYLDEVIRHINGECSKR